MKEGSIIYKGSCVKGDFDVMFGQSGWGICFKPREVVVVRMWSVEGGLATSCDYLDDDGFCQKSSGFLSRCEEEMRGMAIVPTNKMTDNN